MAGKDNPRVEERTAIYRPPAGDMQQLLDTLDEVFSTFRQQLQPGVPRPFPDNALIAVRTFNDILAGLRFEPRRPARQGDRDV